jgi:hypothetical protein
VSPVISFSAHGMTPGFAAFFFFRELTTGFEPVKSAWKAEMLPLHHISGWDSFCRRGLGKVIVFLLSIPEQNSDSPDGGGDGRTPKN